MLKKTVIFLLCVMLSAMCLLTACGSSSSGTGDTAAWTEEAVTAPAAAEYGYDYYSDDAYSGDYDYEYEAPAEENSYESGTSSSISTAALSSSESDSYAETEQKLIYTAEIDMESTDFDAAVSGLAALTERLGGYYESSSQSTRYDNTRYMSITVRVPAENYRAYLTEAGELCHVLTVSEYTQDVSEEYYDVAGRLETQQKKLARLQELLDEAESMEDIIAIESEISNTEQMIDTFTGQIRHYDALVDYSTVTIWLDEVSVETPDADPTFGSRLADALTDGIQGLVSGLQGILIFLAYAWPWIIIIAAIVFGIIALVRRNRSRRAERGESASDHRRRQKKQEKRARRAAKKARAGETSPMDAKPAQEADPPQDAQT